MTRYKRKWNCAICMQPVIYNSGNRTITCGCSVATGIYPSNATIKENFVELKNE